MTDTPTYTTRPAVPNDVPYTEGFLVVQADGVDLFGPVPERIALEWIEREQKIIARGLTPAEKLLGCHMKVYGIGERKWFYCSRHQVNAPCHEAQVVARLLEEKDAAWAALPESVIGDAAPESASLAHRIEAVTGERDYARKTLERCHERHTTAEALEERVRSVLPDLPERARKMVELALEGTPRCEAVSRGDEIERCIHAAGHPPIEHYGWGGHKSEYQHEGRTVVWTSSP